MLDVRITAFSMPRPHRDPPNRLGRFSVIVGPVELRGCLLRVGPDGRVYAYTPRARPGSTIRFSDPSIAARVADAALVAYRALGGVLPTQ